MKVSFWLAWRELANRKVAFLISVCVIASAVALCSATEMVSKARESAVMTKIDNIGPAFRIIPVGLATGDLIRFEMKSKVFSKGIVQRLDRHLSPWVRLVEKRLIHRMSLAGRSTPLIGFDQDNVVSPFEAMSKIGDGDVILGNSLAQRLGKTSGDRIELKDKEFRVAAVLQTTGTGEDIALFLPLKQLQSLSDQPGAVNEIRLFIKPGIPIQDVEELLKSNYPEINAINTNRGQVAERDTGDSLRQFRWILYISTIAIMAFCILIWSYLNAEERLRELATLVSIGGTGRTVFGLLIGRAIIVGLFGSILGYVGGALFTLAQDVSNAWHALWSPDLFLLVIIGSIGISMISVVPVALLSIYREHVAELQE